MIRQETDRIRVVDKTFKPLIPPEEVQRIVQRIAATINQTFQGKEVSLLVILKGAMPFAVDLMRHLSLMVQVETLRASSYHNNLTSTGIVTVEDSLPDMRGKHIIIVEDIVDSGNTIRELIKRLSSQEPASISIAAFLSKPAVHANDISIDFVGKEIGKDFVVGYGLDYAGYGRQLPGVWTLADDKELPNT